MHHRESYVYYVESVTPNFDRSGHTVIVLQKMLLSKAARKEAKRKVLSDQIKQLGKEIPPQSMTSLRRAFDSRHLQVQKSVDDFLALKGSIHWHAIPDGHSMLKRLAPGSILDKLPEIGFKLKKSNSESL